MARPRVVHAGELKAFTPHHPIPTKAEQLGYLQLTDSECKLFSREISAAAGKTRAKLETVPAEIGLEHKFYQISDSDLQEWVAMDEHNPAAATSSSSSVLTGPEALMLK